MRAKILYGVRRLGLMPTFDRLRSHVQGWSNRRSNRIFLDQHPNISMPPPDILYETFRLDYRKYFEDGRKVAMQMLDLCVEHLGKKPDRVLDWGCGPARVIRHFPDLLQDSSALHGTDFNPETIAWCRTNIRGVEFFQNQLRPPTGLLEAGYDLIYGISVLTHLSEQVQLQWLKELLRVAAPKGIVILTTQGPAFRSKLSQSEAEVFDSGRMILRDAGSEGRRTFSSFHPVAAAEQLFELFRVRAYRPGTESKNAVEQDLWVLQKETD